MEKLITEGQLADYLSISKASLHKLRASGALPYRAIGRCIRYSMCEIETWLEKCKGTNGTGGPETANKNSQNKGECNDRYSN